MIRGGGEERRSLSFVLFFLGSVSVFWCSLGTIFWCFSAGRMNVSFVFSVFGLEQSMV
jgi:hypothetical protein